MRRIFVSKEAHSSLIEYLENQNYTPTYVHLPMVYPAIEFHPDLLICHLGSQLFFGDSKKIGSKYPKDIPYNAACTGKFFIHNLKYTDVELLAQAKKQGLQLIHVKQGYTKCNVVVVSKDAIITSDVGIYNACKDILKVLLISPGQVLLPGMNTGFLGGASGKIGKKIVFNGDLSLHNDFEKIVNFIENEGLEAIWFEGYPLIDIGTIISEEKFL